MNVPLLNLAIQHERIKKQLDKRYQDCMSHGKFILGPEVIEAETELSNFCGAKHTLSCSSGTDALRLALMAYNVGPGDEVITTAFTFIATVEMIIAVGATPVLVDIDPKTFNIDVLEVEKAITSKTKAIIPVSLYGKVAPVKALADLVSGKDIMILEDAAQSFGAKSESEISCNTALVSTTSFFPAKPLGCLGDGGAVFTDNTELYEKMVRIRSHGSAKKYYHTEVGIGGRMDTMQCAFLLEKLTIFSDELEKRNAVANFYFDNIKHSDIALPQKPQDNERHAWAQFTLRSKNRDAHIKSLKEKGISTSVHYPIPVHKQPAYQSNCKLPLSLKESELAAQEVFSIPMFPYLTKDELTYTSDCINSL
ncbi:MAG: DegT/DnrJ/EryC1/StrS family aminotransferase [Bdellovibrionales bacterium]